MEEEDSEKLRACNPEFAKMVDIVSGTYLEDRMPATARSKLRQAEMQLHTAKQGYLEQLLLTEELGRVVCTQGEPTSPSSGSSDILARDRSGDLLCSAAELYHSLDIGPEATLLGLQPEHLHRAAAENGQMKASGEVLQKLENSLKEKCLRVVHWHAPQRDSQSDSALALAKMSQLPRLLEQQKAEMEQSEKEKRDARKRCRETRARGVVVLSEMCKEMKLALEKSKLELTAWSNDASLSYLQAEMHALVGKLDMMHFQLLQGICSDGRLQSLSEIRSHLLNEHKRLMEDLSQTRQVIRSYEALGEEFLQLSQQYHKLKEEIENKQWALSELTKSMT